MCTAARLSRTRRVHSPTAGAIVKAASCTHHHQVNLCLQWVWLLLNVLQWATTLSNPVMQSISFSSDESVTVQVRVGELRWVEDFLPLLSYVRLLWSDQICTQVNLFTYEPIPQTLRETRFNVLVRTEI